MRSTKMSDDQNNASLSTDLSNTQVCLLLQQLPQLNGN